MKEPDKSNNEFEDAWWHWFVFGPFTPFFRTQGTRNLNNRESVGLVIISLAVITLGVLAFGGLL